MSPVMKCTFRDSRSSRETMSGQRAAARAFQGVASPGRSSQRILPGASLNVLDARIGW